MRLDAGHGLNLERAEDFVAHIATLDSSGDLLELDLSDCLYVDPGAGWRVGNALRAAAEKCRVVVQVPRSTDGFSGRWFQNFTTSGLGHAIARHAHHIEASNSDVTEELRAYYARPRRQHLTISGLEEVLWSSPNFIYVAEIAGGSLDPNNLDVFETQLAEAFPAVHLQPLAYGEMPPGRADGPKLVLSPIINLFFEAVQNVYDHSTKKPLAPHTSIGSYLSIRYHKGINKPKALSSELPAYLERVKAFTQRDHFRYTGAYLEVVVNDDGVGIPARHSLQLEIFQRAFEEEREIVLAAINTRASVKLRSRDSILRGDPGYGFLKIRNALNRIRAFALIRTGRVLAYYDSTAEAASSRGTPRAGLFRTLDTPLGNMPGTTLQVIFPHRPLTLFSETKSKTL